MQIRRFSLHYASQRDTQWLAHVLDSEGKKLGTRIDLEGNRLRLRWA
jgi:hypothetical protein